VATEPVRKLSRNAHRQRIHLRVRTALQERPNVRGFACTARMDILRAGRG